MKLKFDSNLEFQKDAINAVVDLFEGQPAKESDFSIIRTAQTGAVEIQELGVPNELVLQNDEIFGNLHHVQESNLIPKARKLIEDDDTYKFPNFSVEMETGTGKTYVYLRTIFELNQRYGFKKFIVVVPSVAIREGVLSSIDLMKEHFSNLYGNVPFDHFVYDSSNTTRLKEFARNKEIQIMIINIQAFQKDAGDIADYNKLTSEEMKKLNVIHRADDWSGEFRWIEYIQKSNPIAIIDEPQSVDTTVKAQRAINNLNPLFCLRYSATHKNPYNLVYKLDPIKAYDMKLVKKIEVSSIRSEENYNDVYIRLDKIGWKKGAKTPTATATIHEDKKGVPKPKKIQLKQNTDVSDQTNRPGYEGYIVTNISAEPGLEHVEFANGKILELSEEEGGIGDELLRTQVFQTVEEHFKKEKRFKGKGIKVLSLFFIDKVANYRTYDDNGNPVKGKIAQWFEEAYEEYRNHALYRGLLEYAVDDVHDGYFAADKKKGKVTLKDSSGKTKADDEAYHLIMKDKERLLSNEEPLRFIFSHSALREGWDNPNVFQICTLREMGTDRERRQTLGRGLRLPVNTTGHRICTENSHLFEYEPDQINTLTVIANESFEEYAKGLQDDIENDVGGGFRFGRIDPIAFARLLDGDDVLGQERSEQLWNSLVDSGYLDKAGDITSEFKPEDPDFRMELTNEYAHMGSQISDEMQRYLFKNRISNARQRKKLRYNKRIELNPEFKELWKRICKKTRYSVKFQTEELITKSVDKIQGMDRIEPIWIYVDKTEVDITEAGVESLRETSNRRYGVNTHTNLPDILAFLQRETELTRSTLAEILRQSGRITEFKENPQAFMSEVAKLINRALHEMVVDGIKYEHIQGEEYKMQLFEEKEIEEYLNRLYQVQSSDDRTPYDYIAFDSSVEREIAEKLDMSDNVKFFCKLPSWFKIATPLGDYNPDWALVTAGDEKLYMVKETKSTHDQFKRRDTENKKIDCGKAHFDAIGVDFGVATNIYEVLEK